MSLQCPESYTDEFYTYLLGSIALSPGKLSKQCKIHEMLMLCVVNFTP
jgi:hypothetical protein